MNEPLSPSAAKRVVQKILESGTLRFTGHALDEMKNDRHGEITDVEVRRTLRAGIARPA